MAKQVRAAGGVVTIGHGSDLQVLVTHRPHYDDWSLPKGKRDEGESDEACALREVFEETGLYVQLNTELEAASYTDHKGRPKVVRYWHMTLDPAHYPEGQVPIFHANEEVDEVRLLSPDAAKEMLSYAHDRELIDQVVALAN
jgi:8-oxo-dGTP diphosphatase